MNRARPSTSGARVPRLFCDTDPAPGARLTLPEPSAHHAARVLRLVPGDPVHVFSGDGSEWAARIAAVSKSGVTVLVSERFERDVEASLTVTLAQGISARERMDFTLQKAVELGVAQIQPLETQRSVVRLKEERASRRVEHWQNLVIAACEQCGRNRVPAIQPPERLADWLPQATGLGLVLGPGAAQPLAALGERPGALSLLIGPEGGLAEGEIAAAQASGFIAVSLGPRVLRTETAPLAALAICQARWGDLAD